MEISCLKNLNIIDVACGYSHTLLLDDINNVWSIGNNGSKLKSRSNKFLQMDNWVEIYLMFQKLIKLIKLILN